MSAKPIRRKKLDPKNLKSFIFLIIMLSVAILTFLLATNRIDLRSRANPSNATSILVKFRSPASNRAIEAVNASQAMQQVDEIPVLGIKVLRVPPGKSADDLVEIYKNHPLVEFAEPNDLIEPEIIPNDTHYPSQYHLPKIQAPQAWDLAKAENVLITMCDTGIDGTHPDLQPILRTDLGWNSADGSNNWSHITAHGSYTAGAAAAASNNGIGVAGVAWGAKIIPVRITNNTSGSASVSNAVKCIQYGADKGAKAINLSYRMASYASVETASKYALSKGGVVTVAGGNDNLLQTWTDFPSFLAVAATTSTDSKASYSNSGNYIDIAAPGSSIWTTRTSGNYGSVSGTSMSSPVAAGVVALIAGANPALSGQQVMDIVLSSADDIGDPGEDIYFGAGRVNARRAVLAALGLPDSSPPPTSTQPTPTPTRTPTPTPTPTALPTPTSGPTPTGVVELFTDTYSGNLGGRNKPLEQNHFVTTKTDGPMNSTLTWSGKSAYSLQIFNSNGEKVNVSESSSKNSVNAYAELPGGNYIFKVSLVSGKGSYTLIVSHY